MQQIQLPVDFKAITTTICNLITNVTGVPCIMSEPETQQYPRPPKPYFAIKITTPAKKFGDDEPTNVAGTTYSTGGQRQMSISFQSFGRTHEEAYGYMCAVQSRLDQYPTQAVLRAAGIAVWVIGTVADISQLLNTGYEGRAQMDVEFGIASNTTVNSNEDLGVIEKVTVSGAVSDGVNTTNTTNTISD